MLKHVVHREEWLVFDDFDIFLGSNSLVTVHQGKCPFLARVCQHVRQNRVDRLDRISYVITDLIVDEYLALLLRVRALSAIGLATAP